MHLHLLLDGDAIACRSAGAVQSQHYRYPHSEYAWFDFPVGVSKQTILKENPAIKEEHLEKVIETEDVSHALQICKNTLQGIQDRVEHKYGDSYVGTSIMSIYVGNAIKDNFRYQIAKTKPYKSGREGKKPILTDAVLEYMVGYHNAIVVQGEEAEDRVSYRNMHLLGFNSDEVVPIMVHIDKDLNNTPGWHYNFVKDELYLVSTFKAAYNFYHQMLTGDSTDTIPGLPGIGKKRADAKLAKHKSIEQMHNTVFQEYANYYNLDLGTAKKIFLEQGQLLWIRRKQGEIWDGNWKRESETEIIDGEEYLTRSGADSM